MKIPVTSKKIKSVMKNLQAKKSTEPDGYTNKIYRRFKENLTPMLLKLFQQIEEKGT